jgi:ABC-type glycerol-3-phosphate transport system substrate-binding protein
VAARRGATTITLAFTPDEAGGLKKVIDDFNRQNRDEIQVKWREMPALSADYLVQLQSGRPTLALDPRQH